MKVNGSAALSAEPARVYAALNDPSVLVRTIPGVQRLEQVDDTRYRMTVTAGVASIKGSYDGEVALSEHDEPRSFTLHARGSGAPGTVDATVRVRLEAADGGTRLDYDADAVVGGMVGGVGQRMLTGVAKRMAAEFFGNVDAALTGAAAPAAVSAPAAPTGVASVQSVSMATESTDATSAVYAAPPAGRSVEDEMRVPFWIVLAGVGAGAFWALAGVLIGSRIARRR